MLCWNSHHGLIGLSGLRPWYGCGGGDLSPRVMPSGKGEVDPPFSIQSRVEIHDVSHHGLSP
jgi:hypothetical protein